MRLFLLTSLIIISTIILHSTSSYAQSKFVPGSIVNIDGDTISGFIDYKKWKQNPSDIKFKTNESADVQQYGPEDVKSFKVSNDIYQSRTITVTESPGKTDFITDLSKTSFAQQTAFVLVLVSGKASLYHFVDRKDIDHFYIETLDQPLLELIYHTYYRYENDERVQSENLKYIGQLIAYLSDCSEIQSQIKKTNYASEPLKKVIANYNNCLNVSDFYVQKVEKTNYRFGVFAGISLSSLKFNSSEDNYKYLSSLSFNSPIKPTFGTSLLIEPRRGNERWSLYLDILIKSQYFNAQFTEIENEEFYVNYDVHLGTTSLNMTMMGRYTITGHKIAPYFAAGMYIGTNLVTTNEQTIERNFYGNYTTRTEPVFSTGLTLINIGTSADIGMIYNKLSLAMRFDWGIISPYPTKPTSYAFLFMLGYTFN